MRLTAFDDNALLERLGASVETLTAFVHASAWDFIDVIGDEALLDAADLLDEAATVLEAAQRGGSAQTLLETLSGIDTHDVNLRDHPQAYAAIDAFLACRAVLVDEMQGSAYELRDSIKFAAIPLNCRELFL